MHTSFTFMLRRATRALPEAVSAAVALFALASASVPAWSSSRHLFQKDECGSCHLFPSREGTFVRDDAFLRDIVSLCLACHERERAVQTVLGQLAALAGFDDDARHYMSVAVRESVVNAIKHGNKQDESKRVHVLFTLQERAVEVQVKGQGAGFNPTEVPDPLAPENLLKAYGRGIFFMRQFMDEVQHSFPPKGGTVVRMLKRVTA